MSNRRFHGAQFRALRQTAGVRMADLARAADCHYRHLAQWEKGTRHISPELGHRLARALTDLAGTPASVDEFSTLDEAAA